MATNDPNDPIIADATDPAPPAGMPREVWQIVRHTVALGVIANLSQISAFLRERESEADQLHQQHAEHEGCALAVLAIGVSMGVGASLAIVDSMIEKASASVPTSAARLAQQEGQKAAQARDPEHFHANPAQLEAALRAGFADGAPDTPDSPPVRPVRPRSPRDGGTIH